MLIQLPGGAEFDTEVSPGVTQLAGVVPDRMITLHTPLALTRLIERWKGKPNLAALLASFTDQLQLAENAIHDVNTQRLPDNAGTAQLDVIGKLVGEPRAGLSNAQYRARIKVRIRINQSFGTPEDVIQVLQLLDPALFDLTEGSASFTVTYLTPPDPSAANAIGPSIRQTRAAGVGATVTIPTDLTRGARYGTIHSTPTNRAIGFSSVYDATVGGLFAHIAKV